MDRSHRSFLMIGIALAVQRRILQTRRYLKSALEHHVAFAAPRLFT